MTLISSGVYHDSPTSSSYINLLDDVDAAVDTLYIFRDTYAVTHSGNLSNKNAAIKAKLASVMVLLDDIAESHTSNAHYHYLRGRALNVIPSYDINAETALSKAVKLDPKLVKGWNCLGECYWKRKDFNMAQMCFTGALKYERNKESLRSLSMVVRQMGHNDIEQLKNVKESIVLAKEAVALDIRDGVSWFTLGNAHMAHFFCSHQDPADIKAAFSSYMQAEKDSSAVSLPDLHYNRGTLLRYQERFSEALDAFLLAYKLDPSMKEASAMVHKTVAVIATTHDMIARKGRMKPKRLAGLLECIDKIDTDTDGVLSTLNEGINSELMVSCVVVCLVPSDEPVPQTVVASDRTGVFFALTIYNVRANILHVGNRVRVTAPNLSHISLCHDGKTYGFPSIRIERPEQLTINDEPLHSNAIARSVLNVTNQSE